MKNTLDTSYRTLNPDTGDREGLFRERIRELLDLDWSARNETIYAELRRLKDVDMRVTTLAND